MPSRFRGRRKWLPAPLLILVFAVTTAAQQPAAENPQSKPPESGVITGRVVNESGQPLPGVTIFVGDFGFGGPASRRTATDNEGTFKAQDLDAGIYRVFANSPGYVSENPLQAGPNSSPTYYRPGDSITLTLIKGGVIAGTVTNDAGEPVVNVTVRAFRVRDAEGKPLPISAPSRERPTDDRGYYRICGLQAGTYIVSAGGTSQSFGPFGINAYANDAPTYAPASTRDTAAETVVRAGQEANVDIRYRGEPGHSISGKLSGTQTALPYIPSVRLTDGESHFMIGSGMVTGEDRTFQLNGVSDGDYEISAIGGGPEMVASSARRVSVKGADVTGIELVLAPLASISGRVNIEADQKLNCGRRRDAALRETLISVRRDRVEEKSETKTAKDKSAQATEPVSLLPAASEAVPNDKGEVNFRGLASGTYRFEARLPGAGWYVRAIGFAGGDQKSTAQNPSETNIARDGVALKAGEKVSGVTVKISEGGAGLRARITLAEGQQAPRNLRVDLIPAEKESAENVLRFFETRADSDGSFVIGNIAPGRYWIIERAVGENDSATAKSLRQDALLRSQLLKTAATRKEIQFQPCQRLIGYELPYESAPPEIKSKP